MSVQPITLECRTWQAYTNSPDNKKKIEDFFSEKKNLSGFCLFSNEEVLWKRIGTVSANAEVYIYEIPNTDIKIACKVILLNEYEKYESFIKEIDINKNLYNRDKDHYPEIYGYVTCDNIKIVEKTGIKYKKGIIIFLELLSFTFKQLVDKLSEENLLDKYGLELVRKIINIIYNMNTKHNIVHNDMHLNNIMFKCDKKLDDIKDENIEEKNDKFINNLIPIIIDFGSSKIYNENQLQVDQMDLFNFVNKYIITMNTESNLDKVFTDIYENLKKLKGYGYKKEPTKAEIKQLNDEKNNDIKQIIDDKLNEEEIRDLLRLTQKLDKLFQSNEKKKDDGEDDCKDDGENTDILKLLGLPSVPKK